MSRAGQGRAGQGRAGQGRAGQGKGRTAQTKQHSTKQLSTTPCSTTLAVYSNMTLCTAMQVVPTGRRLHSIHLLAVSDSSRMHQLAWAWVCQLSAPHGLTEIDNTSQNMLC